MMYVCVSTRSKMGRRNGKRSETLARTMYIVSLRSCSRHHHTTTSTSPSLWRWRCNYSARPTGRAPTPSGSHTSPRTQVKFYCFIFFYLLKKQTFLYHFLLNDSCEILFDLIIVLEKSKIQVDYSVTVD